MLPFCENCGKTLILGLFCRILKQFREQGIYLCRKCRKEEYHYSLDDDCDMNFSQDDFQEDYFYFVPDYGDDIDG